MDPKQIFFHWGQVRKGLLETVERFSEAELGYAPVKGGWPVGQVALHIADCEDNWIHGVVRKEIAPWIFYDFADHSSKAEIVEILNRAHAKTDAFLGSLEEADLWAVYPIPGGGEASLYWILWHVLEHEIHHRGELSLVHGLLGREGLDV